MRKILGMAVCVVTSILLLNISPIGACNPRDAKAQCHPVLSTVSPTPSPRVALSSANSTIGVMDYLTNPACFLPDGFDAVSPLGLKEGCPLPFLPTRIVVKTPVAKATPTVKATPRGDSPYSARTMTGEWETIPPGGQVWYRIDNGNNFFLDIWMDTYGKPGVVFSVYSPEQANDLSVSTPPKGRSAPSKEGHDWGWKGSQARGVWHVLVINTTNTPMQYRIDYKQSSIERDCRGYWEWLPTGEYVYWIACRDYGP